MKDKNREREKLAKELEKAKKKLEKLKDWEGRYKALFDRSLYYVFVLDLEGNYIDANKAALNFTSLLDEEHMPLAKKTLAEIIKSGYQNEPTQYKLKRKDEGYVWVETEATLIYKEGEPYGILGIARDITGYKKTEHALRESEEKYRTMVENSLQGIFIIQDFRVLYANEALAHITGYSKEEFLSLPQEKIRGLVHPEDQEMVWGRMAERLAGKDVPSRYDFKAVRKDGDTLWLEMVVGRTEFQGKPAVQGAVIDITDRQQADEQIKASLREKEVMLREIHHRVKNNMQIILSLLRIQSRAVKDRRTREMFKQSQNRIRSMALIHEALYKSKDLAMIDIADYISRMTTHLLSIYREDLGEIEIKQEAEGVFLDINRAIPCGLIISELVSNCLKHAFRGKAEGKVIIRMATDKKGINRLVVKDNGAGMPEGLDYREAETLGLQLVTDLVQQINGSIELKKTHGTEFIVKF